MSTQELNTGSATGNRLRIGFVWDVDRYRQTISLVSDSVLETDPIAILTSVEGDREQVWPPSPPLQDLNFHEVPSGSCAALAVGMAGTSHWSLAWEASQNEPSLLCDVACRVKETPGYLASTWKITDGLKICNEIASDGRHILELPRELSLVVSAIENDEFAARAELVDDLLCLSAHPTVSEPPATIRWRFRITLE